MTRRKNIAKKLNLKELIGEQEDLLRELVQSSKCSRPKWRGPSVLKKVSGQRLAWDTVLDITAEV